MQTKYGKLGENFATHCTAGFLAESEYGPIHYLLTAGHCIAEGQGKPGGGVNGIWESGLEEIGPALGYVFGSDHHLPGGGVTADLGDEGLLYINPKGTYGKVFAPWVIVYGNSGFGTVRTETYPIRGTHFAPKKGSEQEGTPEQFTVCAGGAPTQHEGSEEGPFEESENLKPYQAERCGVTRGFHNSSDFGLKHLEEFWQCDSANPEGLLGGASGSPVYKNGLAYWIYVESSKEEKG